MDYISIIGFIAGFLTTLSFLPQALQAWKTKSTHDISMGMFILMTAGVAFWLTYGLLRTDWPMIFANVVTLVLAGSILLMKVIYR